MTVTDVEPGRTVRRRLVIWGCAAAAVIGVLIAGPIHNWYVDHPHGNPDPGGARIAFLSQAARGAVPRTAVDSHVYVKGFAWDAGGCDGGAAGWARGRVVATFRGGMPAAVDAAMADIGWRVSRWIGGVRDYVPAHGNPYDAVATLFAGHGTWTLEFDAAAAGVPTHTC
jgi:hypothetical protein